MYPAYQPWRSGCVFADVERQTERLRHADICLVGGEDFPDLDWRHDVEAMVADNPRLIVLELSGYIGDIGQQGRPSVDLLVQASSGIAFHQFGTRPIHMGLRPPTYGAVLNGL